MAQFLRETDKDAVRPSRAGDVDLSRDGAALRVEPPRSCAHGAPPSCVACYDSRLRDGERAGGARHLHSALPRAAATHQAGSVMLLSAVLHVVPALRRPGAAARAWRQANLAREAVATA